MTDVRFKLNKLSRSEIVKFCRKRDGDLCYICTEPFTEEDQATIDHFIPLAKGGTWDLENLKLAHSLCNSLKADLMPNPDGSVNLLEKTRKPRRLPRPTQCDHCMTGRLLLIGETCEICGSGPQPALFPTSNKKKVKNCSHTGVDHCWYCVLGFDKLKRGSACE